MRYLTISLMLAGCIVFGSGLTACSRNVTLWPQGDDIVGVPANSVLMMPDERYEVEEPSYLVTDEYMRYIMKARLGE